MRFHYDQQADALYLRFNEKKYLESDEVSPGIILDYDRMGKIIGIEVLDASQRFPKEFTSQFQAKHISSPITLLNQVPA